VIGKTFVQLLARRVLYCGLDLFADHAANNAGHPTNYGVRHDRSLVKCLSARIVVQRSVGYTRSCVYESERTALDQQTRSKRCRSGCADGSTNTCLGPHLRPVDVLAAAHLTIELQCATNAAADQTTDNCVWQIAIRVLVFQRIVQAVGVLIPVLWIRQIVVKLLPYEFVDWIERIRAGEPALRAAVVPRAEIIEAGSRA
jgi:hypothetical protein